MCAKEQAWMQSKVHVQGAQTSKEDEPQQRSSPAKGERSRAGTANVFEKRPVLETSIIAPMPG
jgi:hypothetical protein